ncbi:solute carrier family 46 member 3 isoform X1 [Neodiprion lecontei]|uniref:Solute carrier family 46 member 3 isoform X1 n=1 Tax=Neodiprion lecontei TaxID=441921 RepID=A0A6J0C308_NEOLC|nr:solute carrier family 46 member 3 isoform X1 [Neodiprion lecontei]XP_046592253.1 solute carrier family 46 member 3 isoform X1 [Neodiprion lecontei]XP_046592254.1 solute carrier family 46 member 3 isoform X1 [Neodiprion lecontei]
MSSSNFETVSISVEVRKPNLCKKYLGWIRYVTIEPTMWLYMMAYMTTSVVEQAFYVNKACRVDHGLSEEICDNLSENDTLQTEVQVTVSTFHQWNDIASYAFPIILALFNGNWSDRRGRKAPLVIALIGKVIFSFMIVVNSVLDTWTLNMILYTASLPMALLGSDVAIFASCFSYISDVSSVTHRTIRVAILDVVYLSTMPVGISLGSFLFYKVVNQSYTIMFAINGTLLIVAVIYSVLRLEMRTTPQQMPIDKGTNILLDYFDKKHVVASINTLIKPRPERRRLYLWTLLLAMALYTFQRNEREKSYLYTVKTFSWDVGTFSTFRTVQSSLFVVAMLFGIPIMSKVFKMRDTLIVAVGAISHASGRIFYATATEPSLFYVGAVVAALGPVVAPVLRSMMSKVVPVSERGKVFALLSVCDNAVPLVSTVLYSQLYNATVKTTPSSIYWLTFSTQIAVLLLSMVIHVSLGSRRLESVNEETDSICSFPVLTKNDPSLESYEKKKNAAA